MPFPSEPTPLHPETGEQLISLRQLANSKETPLRRTYDTFLEWTKSGAPNLSGDLVRLEYFDVRGVRHTSQEALKRFIAAQQALTLSCHVIGGCLNGLTARLSDHVQRVTSGDLVRTGRVQVQDGVPADHLYYKLKWVAPKGNLVPFLVWNQAEDSEERIRAIVEGK